MKRIGLFLLLCLLLSCSKDTISAPVETGLILSDNAHVVSTAQANAGILAFEDDQFTITSSSDIKDYSQGDILIFDSFDLHPEGALLKVASRYASSSGIVFETEQIALTEAIKQISINDSIPLIIESYSPLASGVQMLSTSDLHLDFNTLVYDADGDTMTVMDQIRFLGDVTINPMLSLVVEIMENNLIEYKITNELHRSLSLGCNVNTQSSFDEAIEVPLMEICFMPMSVVIENMPLVFTPKLLLSVSIDGDVAEVTTLVSCNDDVLYGMQYSSQSWNHVNSCNPDFSHQQPVIDQGFDFTQSVSEEMNVALYGREVSEGRLDTDFLYSASVQRNTIHSYSLDVLIEDSFIQALDVFDSAFTTQDFSFDMFTENVHQDTIVTNLDPNIPSSPYPAPFASDVMINSSLTWECSDPDDDSLLYDVYLSTTAPLTLNDLVSDHQSENSYSTSLESNNEYFWKIIAHDDHGNSAEGDVWSFETSVIIPDSIVVLCPAGGESWTQGTSHTLQWYTNFTDSVNVELYKGNNFVSVLEMGTTQDELLWSIPITTMAGNDYQIKVEKCSNPDECGVSNEFSIVQPQGTVIIFDDFSNGLSDWIDDGNGLWHIVDEEYHVTNCPSSRSLSCYDYVHSSSFSFQADLHFSAMMAGIVCFASADLQSYYTISITQWGDWGFYRYENGQPETLFFSSLSGFIATNNNHIKLDFNDDNSEFLITINNEPVASIQNTIYTSGYMGLCTYNCQDGESAGFDNVLITDPTQ